MAVGLEAVIPPRPCIFSVARAAARPIRHFAKLPGVSDIYPTTEVYRDIFPEIINGEDNLYLGVDYMKYFGNGLSEQHKNLGAIIRDENKCVDAKRLFLELHSALHLSSISNSAQNEVDALLNDLEPHEYRIMTTAKSETIAWVLWHIARIEDLTMSILVANDEQLFNSEVKKQLNAIITDTGNALTDDEIIELSRQLNIGRLIEYRNSVGQKTRTIVESLTAEDMKRRVSPQGIETIKQIGGVTNQENSL